MASIQVTERRIIVEPVQIDLTTEIEYGPLPACQWNRVQLTEESLTRTGFHALRQGYDWNCYLWFLNVISGTETAWDLSTAGTATFSYWDPIARSTPATLTAAWQSLPTGKLMLTSQSTATLVPGMYVFEISCVIATNLPAVLAAGNLEITRGVPA